MCRLTYHKDRGQKSSVEGLITSFLGQFALTEDEISTIDHFIRINWGDYPPSISQLFNQKLISYVAIFHLPTPSCEVLGFCSFNENTNHIVLENLCMKERNTNASNAFVGDCITYLHKWRKKLVILYVDIELDGSETTSRRFRDMRYSVDGKRIPLLQEYNFDGYRNKKIGNTNLLWKNSPYSRVFISNIEPVVESDTIQNQATTSEPTTSLESSSSSLPPPTSPDFTTDASDVLPYSLLNISLLNNTSLFSNKPNTRKRKAPTRLLDC